MRTEEEIRERLEWAIERMAEAAGDVLERDGHGHNTRGYAHAGANLIRSGVVTEVLQWILEEKDDFELYFLEP